VVVDMSQLICKVDTCERPLKGNTGYCHQCYDNRCRWLKSGKDLELWLPRRIKWLSRPLAFENSNFLPLPQDQRVITRQGGVVVNDKHECRRCKVEKFIVNPTYHLCGNCVGKEMWIGNHCLICDHKFDGNRSGRWLTDKAKLVCNNCDSKMKKYVLDSNELRKLLSIDVCSICDCALSNGKRGRHIDHDHETGLVRGVVCCNCNLAEGYVKAIGIDPITWAKRLISYLEG